MEKYSIWVTRFQFLEPEKKKKKIEFLSSNENIRFYNKNFEIAASKFQNLIVKSFSVIVCFKVKYVKSF